MPGYSAFYHLQGTAWRWDSCTEIVIGRHSSLQTHPLFTLLSPGTLNISCLPPRTQWGTHPFSIVSSYQLDCLNTIWKDEMSLQIGADCFTPMISCCCCCKECKLPHTHNGWGVPGCSISFIHSFIQTFIWHPFKVTTQKCSQIQCRPKGRFSNGLEMCQNII